MKERRADLPHSPTQREDVARTLLALIDLPGSGAKGLALDLIKGDTPIEEAVRKAVEKGVSDFHD